MLSSRSSFVTIYMILQFASGTKVTVLTLWLILIGSRKINIINTCSTSTTVMETSVSSHSLTKFRIKRSIKYVTNYAGWHTPSLMHNKETASDNTSYYFCKNFMAWRHFEAFFYFSTYIDVYTVIAQTTTIISFQFPIETISSIKVSRQYPR